MTPAERAHEKGYRVNAEGHVIGPVPLEPARSSIVDAALFSVEGFLEMGLFAGDELCIQSELILDELQGGFVEQMIHRCQVSAMLWRAGK